MCIANDLYVTLFVLCDALQLLGSIITDHSLQLKA